MGKTLTRLAFGLLGATVVAASFFVGLNIEKIKGNQQNVVYASETNLKKENKTTGRRLEDYFIQDKETENIILYSSTKSDIIKTKKLDSENRKKYEADGIVRSGSREYLLSATAKSRPKDLWQTILEFESVQAREEYLEKNKDKFVYPILVKDNIASVVEKSTVNEAGSFKDVSFGEEQQTMYLNLMSHYAAKRGMEIILSKDDIGEERVYNEEENRQEDVGSKIVSSSNSESKETSINRASEPESITTNVGLEKYLFQENELRFLELSKENVSYQYLEEGGPLTIPYELFKKEFSSNPVRIKRNELEEESIKNFFNKYGLEEFEWAAYEIPEREAFSKWHNLTLFLFKFDRKERAKEFLMDEDICTRFPAFVKGDMMSVIYSPTFEFVYRFNMLSQEQKVIYMNLIFDYKDRTKTELILSNEEEKHKSRLALLEDLRKKYSWKLVTD